MLSAKLKKLIRSYPNFPNKGIVFRDFLPVLSKPLIWQELIECMSTQSIINEADAILAIDARGFLIGSSIALKTAKPIVVARKRGKLPGEIITKSYDLEYGNDSLSIQKDALEEFKKYVIVDDLLATGGTAQCVSNILISAKKEVMGLSVVIELNELNGKSYLEFPVISQVQY